jgi:hypothetical protein
MTYARRIGERVARERGLDPGRNSGIKLAVDTEVLIAEVIEHCAELAEKGPGSRHVAASRIRALLTTRERQPYPRRRRCDR